VECEGIDTEARQCAQTSASVMPEVPAEANVGL
jgi:hypothetical protein